MDFCGKMRPMDVVLTWYQGAVGKGPRYAVYDFEYNLASGDGVR